MILNSKKIEIYLIWYYIIIFLIQLSWTDMYSFPPTALRWSMYIAVFLPLFIMDRLIPFVFTLSIILRGNFLTDFQYLPNINSFWFYWGTLLALFIVNFNKIRINSDYIYMLIIFIFYLLIDLALIKDIDGLGGNVKSLGYMLLLFPFLNDKRSLQYMALAFVISSFLLSIYYIVYRDMFMMDFFSAEKMQRSSWSDPNYFSTTLCIGYSLTLMLLLNYLKRLEIFITSNIFLILFIVVEIVAILLLASRVGIVSMAVITLFVVLYSEERKIWKIATLFFIIATVVVMLQYNLLYVVLWRFQEEGNIVDFGGRLEIWQLFIDNFTKQPIINMVFGNGFEDVAKLANGQHLHNDWLGVINNYGLVGVLMWFYLFIKLFKNGKDNKMTIIVILLLYFLASFSLNPSQRVYYPLLILWGFGIKRFSREVHIQKLK